MPREVTDVAGALASELKRLDQAWRDRSLGQAEIVESFESLADVFRSVVSSVSGDAEERETQPDLLIELVCAAPSVFRLCMLPDERIHLATIAKAIVPDGATSARWGTLCMLTGVAQFEKGNLAEAVEELTLAVTHFTVAGEDRGLAVARFNLGCVQVRRGDSADGLESLERAYAQFEDMHDPRGMEDSNAALVPYYRSKKQFDKAMKIAERYLRFAESRGDIRATAVALGQVGNCCRSLKKPKDAIAFHGRRLELAEQLGDLVLQRNAIGNLANAYSDIRDFQRAIDRHKESIAFSRTLGDSYGEAKDLLNLGDTHCEAGNHVEAEQSLERALEICHEKKYLLEALTAASNLAELAEKSQRFVRAIRLISETLLLCEAVEDPKMAELRDKIASWTSDR